MTLSDLEWPWVTAKYSMRRSARVLSATAEILVSLICLFVPCVGLSWLHVSFLLHVKYTVSYSIVSCCDSELGHAKNCYIAAATCTARIRFRNKQDWRILYDINSFMRNCSFRRIAAVRFVDRRTCMWVGKSTQNTFVHATACVFHARLPPVISLSAWVCTYSISIANYSELRIIESVYTVEGHNTTHLCFNVVYRAMINLKIYCLWIIYSKFSTAVYSLKS